MKIKQLISAAFILFFVNIILGSSCKKNSLDCHKSFIVQNQSQSDIYFGYSTDSTLVNLNYLPTLAPETRKVFKNTQKPFFDDSCFETMITNDLNSNHFYIFIFDAQVLENTNWDTVKQNHLLLKRYGFTKAELDAMDWTISYP